MHFLARVEGQESGVRSQESGEPPVISNQSGFIETVHVKIQQDLLGRQNRPLCPSSEVRNQIPKHSEF